MKRSRQVVAIALVAAALCADRAVAAAPALRPQVSGVAGKLVTRLSVSFRRVVPAARVYQTRCDQGVAAIAAPVGFAQDDTTVCFRTRLSPTVLSLPPPLV